MNNFLIMNSPATGRNPRALRAAQASAPPPSSHMWCFCSAERVTSLMLSQKPASLRSAPPLFSLQRSSSQALAIEALRCQDRGELERALGCFEQAAALASDEPAHILGAASMLVKLNRLPEAMEHWKQAKTTDLTHSQAEEVRKRMAEHAHLLVAHVHSTASKVAHHRSKEQVGQRPADACRPTTLVQADNSASAADISAHSADNSAAGWNLPAMGNVEWTKRTRPVRPPPALRVIKSNEQMILNSAKSNASVRIAYSSGQSSGRSTDSCPAL